MSISCSRFSATNQNFDPVPYNAPFFADKIAFGDTYFSILHLRVLSDEHSSKKIDDVMVLMLSATSLVHAIIDTGASSLVLPATIAGRVFGIVPSLLVAAIDSSTAMSLPDGSKLSPVTLETAAGNCSALQTHTVVAYLNTCTHKNRLLCCRKTGIPYRVPTTITKCTCACVGKPILSLFNLDFIGAEKDTTMLVPFFYRGNP